MVELTRKTPTKGGWKDGRRTNRGRYVRGEEIEEINQKYRALEAERDALKAAGEALYADGWSQSEAGLAWRALTTKEATDA